MHAHLTEVSVRALKPGGKQVKVWDTTTPGFGIIVGKSQAAVSTNGVLQSSLPGRGMNRVRANLTAGRTPRRSAPPPSSSRHRFVSRIVRL